MAFEVPLITDQVDVAIATKTANGLLALRDGSAIVGVGGGTANAQTVTTTPAFTSLTNGLVITYKPTVTNTGNVTLALDGFVAKGIIKQHGTGFVNLIAGDLTLNVQAFLVYVIQNDAYILLNPASVVHTDKANTFTAQQNINKGLHVGNQAITGTAAVSEGNLVLSGSVSGLSLIRRDHPPGAVGSAAGDLFLFYAPNSNNFVLWTPTTGNIVEWDNTGRQILPVRPAFQVEKNLIEPDVSGAGISGGTFWQVEIFDDGANFANNTFTAPVTGRYLLSLMIEAEGITNLSTDLQARIFTSNRVYVNQFGQSSGVSNYSNFTHTLTVVADMDANDTASTTIKYNGEGTNIIDIGLNSVFSGCLLN